MSTLKGQVFIGHQIGCRLNSETSHGKGCLYFLVYLI